MKSKKIITYKDIRIDKRILKYSFICISIFIYTLFHINPVKANAENNTNQGTMELHAFYPSNTKFTDQVKRYIDQLDSISFAWSRIDGKYPGTLNTVYGKNDNYGFYYPKDYMEPIEYAESKGKSIQLNIFMDQDDCKMVLPSEDQRATMIKAIIDFLQTDISQGKGIYYDGVVIDFEGLKNTGTDKKQILYSGKPISTYFTQFLKELRTQLTPLNKHLYVAVNPSLYYDGYDYAAILNVADRVIMMAHDYEPVERLQKNQVQQYTGYNALEPIDSMAPILKVRKALNDMKSAASTSADLSKVWLQITFDSAQWQFDVKDANEWGYLEDNSLSKKSRDTPLYSMIKDRVTNTDGYGQNISYGYNNELQTPYIQYFNTSNKTWNVILYEDSNSLKAKIDLSKSFGIGGISLWSLANVPDYTDKIGMQYHLNGWTTILDELDNKLPTESNQAIKFKDAAVEKVVRNKLGKLTETITSSDLLSIYRLKLPQEVKSLSDLKYLTNLEYLDAQKLGLQDITVIGKLTNLRVLYLQRNNISDISVLKKLKKLEILSLNGNEVSSITSLASLSKLKELYIRENKIKSITSLSKLSNLVILEIGDNNISNIDAVKNLKKLRQLSFDKNKITDIQPLKKLTELEILYLQRNSISNITPVSGLKKLKVLSLNGNKISDLKPLSKLTTIEKLYLRENKITNVKPLKSLNNLKELYLEGNQITDYSPLSTLYKKADFTCDFKLS